MSLVSNLQSLWRRGLGRRRHADSWPFVAGKYKIVDATAPVVVVMADAQGAGDDLASLAAQGLCMVAPTCRSVSDAAKLIKNVAANLSIHYVIFAGETGQKSAAVEALHALFGARGIEGDESVALMSQLRARLDTVDIDALLKQVKAVDMLGCEDLDKIVARIADLAKDATRPNTGFRAPERGEAPGIERVIAATHIAYDPQVDKAGGYVIRLENSRIIVEHYNSKRELLRVIEGKTARDLCITLIRNGWVSKLDHAAYLGRELTLAEAALTSGIPYLQDSDAALASTEITH